MAAKVGKGGNAVVQDLGAGRKLSVTATPAGPRAAVHEGGVTRAVDPRAYGVEKVSGSAVGGGNTRVTLKATDGTATDFTTTKGGRQADEVVHNGPNSKPKK